MTSDIVPPPDSLVADLAIILETVHRPGGFSTAGVFDLLPPSIEIDGFGLLALPVLPDQAARLVSTAERAPFGRGERTIVDTSVRRSWQIASPRVDIRGKRWAATLETLVARAAQGLGVSDAVEAEFYKLLVYEAGDFFVSHRDTEKSPGMFATLLIALPAVSTGGDLLVRHGGQKARIDMRGSDPGEARFAAFYADCVHEVLPVETGCRVTLVYNLIRKGKGVAPEPPRYDREVEEIARLLDAWRTDEEEEGGPLPAKVVYPLAHAYTPAELSFAALKGADAAAAGALAQAATRAACDIHLALLTIEQTGSPNDAEVSYSRRGRWSEPDDDEYDMDEVFDHSETLSDWRRLDDSKAALGDMPVDEGEFSPPDAVEAMTPDEQHLHEATGNEGASLERTYRRAALVVWPRAAFLPMIASAGIKTSLPHLAAIVVRCRGSTGEEAGRLAREADDLAKAVIGSWPDERRFWRPGEVSPTTTLLDLLTALRASDRIVQFLGRPGAGDNRSGDDGPAIAAALEVLSPPQRLRTIEAIIDDSGARCFALCADVLARGARSFTNMPPSDLKPAAKRLLALCPSDQNPSSGIMPWQRLDRATVVALIGGLALIDPGLADRAVGVLLASPRTFDMDDWLFPAWRVLMADPAVAASSAVAVLRHACVAHFEARVALPLAPPADFRRVSTLTCGCTDCAALSRFLADPAAPSWAFKAMQSARTHVENTISRSRCDVDMATLRKGSPHQLIVTKNQNSYDRLAKQRADDLDNLNLIESSAVEHGGEAGRLHP